jgi:hypothetical protein
MKINPLALSMRGSRFRSPGVRVGRAWRDDKKNKTPCVQ